ncbi:MAG: ferrous iron transport protein B [Pirellulales bacterium]
MSVVAHALPVVALIGNPNTGKSTLFTALAGVFQRTGNYPGVTVEKKLARMMIGGRQLTLVDLPGTYGLAPCSPDEMVAVDLLLGRQSDVAAPNVVICILDASNLERNLYLATQVLGLGIPAVVALNMNDVAQDKGITIDRALLERRLGVPVVEIQAHRKQGLEELKSAVGAVLETHSREPLSILPERIAAAVARLRELDAAHATPASAAHPASPNHYESTPLDRRAWPDFLLERALLDTSGYLDETLQATRPELLNALKHERAEYARTDLPLNHAEAIARYGWIETALAGVVARREVAAAGWRERWDAVLTHRVWGIVAFLAVMTLLFSTIFWLADPLMGWIDAGVEAINGFVENRLDDGPLRSLLTKGVIGGVGGVIVFVPQIMMLFFFIALLEDCGYMSRAAYLMDKLMSRVGLSGKSFIPLLSSFACAIPGIMATRTIENRRDRLATMLIAPLMSCSARLPVYYLLTEAFVPPSFVLGFIPMSVLVLLSMYALGAVTAAAVAFVLKKTLLKGETPPLVMELPPYKAPSLKLATLRMLHQAWAFIAQAGTLILLVSIVVWALQYYPRNAALDAERTTVVEQRAALEGELESLPEDAPARASLEERIGANEDHQKELEGALQRDSFLGRAGRFIEPVVEPLGWDWRIGSAVIASFPAREVVLGTLGVIYNLGDEVEVGEESGTRLERALQDATWEGSDRKVFTIPVALSVMAFFSLCAMRRDVGRHQTRNRHLALARVHVRLHDRAGLRRGVDRLPSRHMDLAWVGIGR